MPPPALLAAAMALFTAGVSLFEPSPLAPKAFTLNTGVAAGWAGRPLAWAPPGQKTSNPMMASSAGQLRRNTAHLLSLVTYLGFIVCKRFQHVVKTAGRPPSVTPTATG